MKYYSEELNKMFENADELLAAEAEFLEKKAREKAEAEKKEKELKDAATAFKEHIEAATAILKEHPELIEFKPFEDWFFPNLSKRKKILFY